MIVVFVMSMFFSLMEWEAFIVLGHSYKYQRLQAIFMFKIIRMIGYHVSISLPIEQTQSQRSEGNLVNYVSQCVQQMYNWLSTDTLLLAQASGLTLQLDQVVERWFLN